MKKYEIIRVTRRYAGRCTITHEKTVTTSATYDEVIALAEKDGADLDEVKNDLEYCGAAWTKHYMISEYPF